MKTNDRIDGRIERTRQWMEDNGWGDDEDGAVTLEDAYGYMASNCGRMPDGGCSLAGSEECDFECPFRDEA